MYNGAIAKWLRRQIRNLFSFGGAGSNPAGVDLFSYFVPVKMSLCPSIYFVRMFLPENQKDRQMRPGPTRLPYRDARQTLLCSYVMELVRRLSNKQVSISNPCLLWHHLSASTWGRYILACLCMGITSLVDCSQPAILSACVLRASIHRMSATFPGRSMTNPV